MEKLLVINAHPKVDDASSVSLQVLHHFLEKYRAINPVGTIEQIDLYREPVPGVNNIVLRAWEKSGRGEQLTEEEERLTSRMSENGSVGLLTDGRSVLVIQTSDGVYTNNDWYTEVEYSHKYLKSMFNFIGVEKYKIIRAQGNAFLDRSEILAKAFQEAELAVASFIGSDIEGVVKID